MTEYIKYCSKHGNLTWDQVRKDGEKFRCKACRMESNKKSYDKNQEKRVAYSMKWKKENKEQYLEWLKSDRKNNPEKHKKWEKTKRDKLGYARNKIEISRVRGITVDQYDNMLLSQDNKCAICHKPEKRKKPGGGTLALCLDHNHATGKVRAFLCHNCNTMIGKFKENIETIKNAINYLKTHGELCQK